MIEPTKGVLDINFRVCVLSNLARIFVSISRDRFILSRLPNGKIEKFLIPLVYLIPFPEILNPTFSISRLTKWQIPRPEKVLLGPCY